MSDKYIAVRQFTFVNGTIVTVPVRVCDTMEDAKRVIDKDAASMRDVMQAQLVAQGRNPSECTSLGMTAGDLMQHIGLRGISGGCQVIPQDSVVIKADVPRLIIPH